MHRFCSDVHKNPHMQVCGFLLFHSSLFTESTCTDFWKVTGNSEEVSNPHACNIDNTYCLSIDGFVVCEHHYNAVIVSPATGSSYWEVSLFELFVNRTKMLERHLSLCYIVIK